jgi:gluconolactonase
LALAALLAPAGWAQGTEPSVTFRNGSGINPPCMTSLNLPEIGQPWMVQVDTSSVPGATWTLIEGRKRPSAGTFTPAGELLINTSSRILFQRVKAPTNDIALHTVNVPNQVELVGFTYSMQATIGNPAVQLCNAEDLVLGFILPATTDPLSVSPPTANVVRTGFVNTEGPVWHEGRSALIFSDMQTPLKGPGGRIYELELPSNNLSILRGPSNNSNGLVLHPNGNLLIAEQHTRRVTSWDFSGGTTTLAATWNGTQLNAPNGIDVRSDGTIYFSDPKFINPFPPVLPFNGLYRIDTSGTLRLERKMHSPNGLALSPDESRLYVVNQNLGNVVRFDVQPDGSLGALTLFAFGLDVPDGVRCDSDGNVYVTTEAPGGAGRVHCFAPNGALWGTVDVPEPARNCNFGMADRKTLFITAHTTIYSIPVAVPGPAPQPRVTARTPKATLRRADVPR